jgi:cell division protein FtsL
MSKAVEDVKPFLSVLIFVGAMFFVVFFKMEVRRMGYAVWRLSRAEKSAADQKRLNSIELAKLSSPGRIEKIAQKNLALAKPSKGQMVQMNGEVFVLDQ